MKKQTIIIIVAVVAAVVFVLGSILAVGGFFIIKAIAENNKEPLTAYEFTEKMQEEGLNVQTQYSTGYGVINSKIAKNYYSDYKIEFYVMSSQSSAINLYESKKSIMESSHGVVTTQTKKDTKNISKFTRTVNGKYMVVSRIGDTVVYVNADAEYKDKIKEHLKAIGY